VACGLAANLGAFGGELTLADLFPDAWIEAHTDFADVDELLTHEEFGFDSPEAFHERDDEAWDDFVAAHTDFDSWGEMLSAAIVAYTE